ncbi:uncharacterized protein RJT21DRAFT_44220 [Scheffersomyces amazonensis]|uniref:uncharacterized protein n=1 Tax=Scheffersomyces amazonensis TaxID=1078765 RepID=UPI00315D541F
MDDSPSLVYSSQPENKEFLRNRNIPIQEDSISIETDDEDTYEESINDYSNLHNDRELLKNDNEFQAVIRKLKSESTQRFKNKWEEILHKYSIIDDEKESDEIDLSTGLIIRDNGHLRSLNTSNERVGNVKLDRNIWDYNYDVDKEVSQQKSNEARRRRRKQELKAKLKQEQKFHNINLQNEINSKSKKRIPTEDNLLQLDPSPTKKSRLQISRSSSPIKLEYISPMKGKIPCETVNVSPIKARNLNNSNPFQDDTQFLSYVSKESSYMSSHDSETSETSRANPSDDSDNLYSTPKYINITNNTNTYESSTEGEESESFDDEYSIVLDPLGINNNNIDPIPETIIYQCAFSECTYCTGNKSLYQSHLLEKHSAELHFIGYPISPIPDYMPHKIRFNEQRLNKHFPLTYDVPPIPDSGDGQAIICNKSLENGKLCQKSFPTMKHLLIHQQENSCSSKKQVLMCPLLGCGFLTEDGYLEWRAHFIKENHHLQPTQRESSNFQYDISDELELEEEEEDSQPGAVPEDINELFSDEDSEFDNQADEESGAENEDDEQDDEEEEEEEQFQYLSPIKREIRHVSVQEPCFSDVPLITEETTPKEIHNDSLDELFK